MEVHSNFCICCWMLNLLAEFIQFIFTKSVPVQRFLTPCCVQVKGRVNGKKKKRIPKFGNVLG